MPIILAVALLAVLALASPAAARPGDLDRSFGVGGTALERSAFSGVQSAVVRSDGSAFLADPDRVVRVTPAGRIDEGFKTPPELPSISAGPVVDREGRLLIVTRSRFSMRGVDFALVRLQPSGAEDRSFGEGGRRPLSLPRGLNTFLTALELDRKGRLLVAGSTRRAGRQRAFIARFLTDGTLDTRFGNAGLLISRRARVTTRLLVGKDGSLVAAESVPLGPETQKSVLRLHAMRPSGATDKRFGRRGFAGARAGGRRLFGGAQVEAGARGSLLVVGVGRRPGGRADRRSTFAVRLTRRGKVDRTFGARGLARLPSRGATFSVAFDQDRRGRIVTAGTLGFPDRVTVTRLRRDGRPDRRFGRRGVVRFLPASRPRLQVIAALASDVAVRPNGRILIAGAAFDDNVALRDEVGQPYFALTRLKG